jgi:hypothetical protein
VHIPPVNPKNPPSLSFKRELISTPKMPLAMRPKTEAQMPARFARPLRSLPLKGSE